MIVTSWAPTAQRRGRGVYVIYCVASARGYVGSAADVYARLAAHRSALRAGTHSNAHLQRAWAALGPGPFVLRQVEAVAAGVDLLDRENAWLLGCGDRSLLYNTTVPATRGREPGFRHSDATRAAMSAAQRGTTRPGVAAANRRRQVSAATRAKQSASLKASPRARAAWDALGEAKRGVSTHAGEANPKAKLTHELVAQLRADYADACLATGKPPRGWTVAQARRLGVGRDQIWEICRGRTWRQ